MKTILINPAPHGNGPYLVALKFARELDNQLGEKSIKIIPYYIQDPEIKDLQRKILTDHNFGEDVFLDPDFGSLINSLTFKGDNYGNRLIKIAQYQRSVENNVKRHFDNNFLTYNLITDEAVQFNNIDLEIAHNNIVSTQFKSFLTTIAPFSKLIKYSYDLFDKINPNYELTHEDSLELQLIGNFLEDNAEEIFTSTPSTLTHLNSKLYFNEELIPPFIQISNDQSDLEKGVYVIRSGIGGKTKEQLEDILKIFKKRNYKIYSASPQENELYANEKVISNPAIEYVVARLGLSAVYLSTQHEKPLITFPFQPWDDFEMWHNEQTFCNNSHLPLVLKYTGDESFLEKTAEIKSNIKELNSCLEENFGTRDGIKYGAQKIKEYL